MSIRSKALLLALLPGSSFMLVGQQYVISTVAGGAPQWTPIAATAASIGAPSGVAVDASDNVYVEAGNCVYRIDRGGTLIRIAGNSRAGYSGDGGPALNAELNNPEGLAIDSAGSLYITDAGNYRVRKVSKTGIITTAAGDGAPATLNFSGAIAVDPAGNIYVGDQNYHVRRISTSGVVSIFAGNGIHGFSGDGGPAVAAQITLADGLAADQAGNIYIADSENNRIRKVTPDGIISTFAGNGAYGKPTDGARATESRIYSPGAIAIDSAGTLYTGNSTSFPITRITSDGVISTVYAGDAVAGTTGGPLGLGVDSAGNVYGSDYFRYIVRRITPTGTVTTEAGNGTFSFSGDGGPATRARLFGPAGMTFDAKGNLYLCDSFNGRVRVIAPNGIISTITGTGEYTSAGDGGPAINAALFRPEAVVEDRSGNLYIADTNDIGRIRKISPDGIITTFAGNGNYGFSGDGGPAASARVYGPISLAMDAAGNLYFADSGNNRVRRIAPDGIVTTVAGTGTFGGAGEGGPAAAAQLAHPFSIGVDDAGDLFIYDEVDYDRITKVSPDGVLTRVTAKSDIGGPPTSRQQIYINGLAVDASGTVYFTDTFNQRVRRLSPDGSVITIAGNGKPGYSGDGGLAMAAQLFNPMALALDSEGNVYIADDGNQAVRRLQPLSSDISITAVTNAASNLPGPVAPGEMVVLYGSGLGPATLTAGDAGVATVLFNGTAGRVIYASNSQTAAVVPGLAPGAVVEISVSSQGRTSKPFRVQSASAATALFTLDSTGQGQAVAFNEDGTLNSAENPARPESSLFLYATGGIQGSGSVTLGGKAVPPFLASFSGGEGVQWIRITIPAGVPGGSDVAVAVTSGGAATQAGVTVAIGGK